MTAVDTLSDAMEAFAQRPMYVDVRPLVVAIVLVTLYVLYSELPTGKRYLNMMAMARDHKPRR